MIAKNELQNYVTRIIEHNTLVDATPGKGGSGKYIRPHELLEAALATCMNISLRMEACRKGINLDNVEIKVELNRNDPTKTIFEYSYKLSCSDDLNKETLDNFKQVLQQCSVKKTLSREIVFKEK